MSVLTPGFHRSHLIFGRARSRLARTLAQHLGVGLAAHPQYNGRVGVATSWDARRRRWRVDLESDASYVLLKISAQEADTSGTETFAPYTNGKPYRVQFR